MENNATPIEWKDLVPGKDYLCWWGYGFVIAHLNSISEVKYSETKKETLYEFQESEHYMYITPKLIWALPDVEEETNEE
jgi:hypothetical protein